MKKKNQVYIKINFFSNIILRFLETGIYDQWIVISERMKTESPNETQILEKSKRFEILTLSKTEGIFELLIFGNMASTLLLIIELLLFFIFLILR
jgi:hypothetical protein